MSQRRKLTKLFNRSKFRCLIDFLQSFQIREQREHDHPLLDQGVQLREAGGREVGDRARQIREREVRLQDLPESDVRIHDQLHPQAKALAREVHDEFGARELHDSTGKKQSNETIRFS